MSDLEILEDGDESEIGERGVGFEIHLYHDQQLIQCAG